MEGLSEIYLNETAVEELPSSIKRLQGLVLLHLRNCRSLIRLPDNIRNLVHLKDLTVSGCSKLYHLPENLGNLESFMYLEVGGSGIREFPVSILRLKRLKSLSCEGCKEMTMLFSSWSPSIEEHHNYSRLLHLDLSDTNLRELSDGIAQLVSLKTLKLRRTNLESLPATMNRLHWLTRLELEACKRLKSVPELPSSINYIDAHDCSCLESVARPNIWCPLNLCFTFSNCLQLVQTNLFRDIVETHSHEQGNYQYPLSFNMSLPGSEIPEWFNYQHSGLSLTVHLPPNWLDNKFLGLAICAVCDFKGSDNAASNLSAVCLCHLKGNHGQFSFRFTLLDWGFTNDRILESDHMFLAYVPWSEYRFIEEGKLVNERYFTEATFEIAVENRIDRAVSGIVMNRHCIRSCGVRLFHSNYMEEQTVSITESGSYHDSCGGNPDGGQKTPALERRRGSYKRRKNSESWTTVSSSADDGKAWRKYGQKEILNASYPRGYYRCTYKYDQGCQATKQIQQMQDTPKLYRTTYIGKHTCGNMMVGAPKDETSIARGEDELTLTDCDLNVFLISHN